MIDEDYLYDREGRPITLEQWAELRRNRLNIIVARAQWGADPDDPEVTVSTVWLGLDHGWGEGPPLIFETKVFGGPLDDETKRYATEDEAHLGHARMVERVAEARVPRHPTGK